MAGHDALRPSVGDTDTLAQQVMPPASLKAATPADGRAGDAHPSGRAVGKYGQNKGQSGAPNVPCFSVVAEAGTAPVREKPQARNAV